MTVDTSLGSDATAGRQTGLMSASSTSSSSGSDTELRSPFSSAFYGSPVEGTPLQVEKTADQEGKSVGESRNDIDIFSALRWSRSATKVDAVPTLPPIPKMADLMEGLFSTVSTPEQDQSPGRNVKGDEGEYHHLLPSYTTSTSYPHLAQLASPFLHPRPAPSPPSLSLPTAIARTPTISKVQPIPSCFPSIGASGHGGLCALGLVLEGDERAEIPARDTQVEGAVDDDPFRRSFDALSSTRTREALAPPTPPTFDHATKHRTPKSASKHRHRHSYLPYETYISSGEQFIPYTPPGQRRMAPLRCASEKLVPSSSGMYMGMSRSLSNLHLPYRDKGIGASPSPPKELYSRFDPDNDGGSDATDRSTVGAGVNKSPIYRFGRTLTRTRSGWGALLKGRGGPHTPRLVPRDLQVETPYRPAMPRVAEQQPAKVGGAKLAGKLGLDRMEGRWLRMGLGRRKSSD